VPRYDCRKDNNHDALCTTLTKLGVLLWPTWQHAQYTPGWPDVFAVSYEQPGLIEIKGEGDELTEAEEIFRMLCDAVCPDLYVIMRTDADAVAWVERCRERSMMREEAR